MPESLAAPDQLALAVAGLSGLIGFIALPALGAWLRIAMAWLDADRSGLARPRRPSWLAYAGAATMTVLWLFLLMSHLRAAGQLRQVRLEAPVVGTTVWGLLIGVAFWAVYALGLGALRTDLERATAQRRIAQTNRR